MNTITLSTYFLLLAGTALAEWPQILGPTRDGVAVTDTIGTDFPSGEPEIVWSKAIGSGFAGPVVAGGKVFVFHRQGDEVHLDALDASKGEQLWRFSYPTDYRDDFGFDNGPRAVPLVAEGRVFINGAEGMLHCIDSETGDKVWAKDLRKEFNADKGFFGRAPSPLIVGDTLILQIGGEGAGIIGLNSKDGNLIWKATDHECGYASPIAVTLGGQPRVLAFTREGFVCLDPTTGKVLIDKRHRAEMHASVNAATPIFFEPNRVFLSACYGVGAALWEISPDKGTTSEIWSAEGRLDSHYATPVRFGNHLIGFHGRQESGTVLRCIDATTGKVAWASESMPAGTVTRAGETLVILTERGELLLAKADRTAFEPTARGQILGNGTRALPALSDGLFFARDTKRLVCVKLSK
jgi:outer membrane protein assembly factor BamB